MKKKALYLTALILTSFHAHAMEEKSHFPPTSGSSITAATEMQHNPSSVGTTHKHTQEHQQVMKWETTRYSCGRYQLDQESIRAKYGDALPSFTLNELLSDESSHPFIRAVGSTQLSLGSLEDYTNAGSYVGYIHKGDEDYQLCTPHGSFSCKIYMPEDGDPQEEVDKELEITYGEWVEKRKKILGKRKKILDKQSNTLVHPKYDEGGGAYTYAYNDGVIAFEFYLVGDIKPRPTR